MSKSNNQKIKVKPQLRAVRPNVKVSKSLEKLLDKYIKNDLKAYRKRFKKSQDRK